MSPTQGNDKEAKGPAPRTGITRLFETMVQVPDFVSNPYDDEKLRMMLNMIQAYEGRVNAALKDTTQRTAGPTPDLTNPEVFVRMVTDLLGNYLARFRDLAQTEVEPLTARFGEEATEIINKS